MTNASFPAAEFAFLIEQNGSKICTIQLQSLWTPCHRIRDNLSKSNQNVHIPKRGSAFYMAFNLVRHFSWGSEYDEVVLKDNKFLAQIST